MSAVTSLIICNSVWHKFIYFFFQMLIPLRFPPLNLCIKRLAINNLRHFVKFDLAQFPGFIRAFFSSTILKSERRQSAHFPPTHLTVEDDNSFEPCPSIIGIDVCGGGIANKKHLSSGLQDEHKQRNVFETSS